MSESWKQEFVTYLEESTSATPLVSQALCVKEQKPPGPDLQVSLDIPILRTNLERMRLDVFALQGNNDPYDSWLVCPATCWQNCWNSLSKKKTGNEEILRRRLTSCANTAKNLKIFRDLAKVRSFSESMTPFS